MAEKKTDILERDSFYIVLMVVIIIGFFQRILFTNQIIRASDVVTQFFWGAKAIKEQSLLQFIQGIPAIFQASWDPLSDGGRTLEGGWNAIALLFHRYLIQHFFPFPASIAWLAVLAMCWGSIGTFLYCRLIGVGRLGAFAAGLLYVVCTENSSLINAGHIQKLEAICWFPWTFLLLEKSLRSRRFLHYALTALMLAIQFFHMHWQISFYSCLAVGAYWFWYEVGKFRELKGEYGRQFSKDTLLAVALVVLFFSTIAMSFAPLYSWSQQSERGEAVSSGTGSSATKAAEKGIGYEEGMSWSMPPEEILSFFVPGLFGYSRQEGGDVPAPGQVYYWGRMRFTQTSDYLGLLPWFLIPLPLFFRRDRYTCFLTFLMAATLIMALGKYTFVYRFMFEYLPAFSKFRVPKMILFLFAFGAAVLAGRGLDVLADETIERKRLGRWVWWCGGVAAFIGLICLVILVAGQSIISAMSEYITAPTRYQSGSQLVEERFGHMFRDGIISFGMAAIYLAAIIVWFKRLLPVRLLLPLLILLMLCDLWRVNNRFLVVAPPPEAKRGVTTNDIVTFLKPRIDHYRMQPLNDENAHFYADNGFANVSAYVTISERRYKQFLDAMSLMSTMPDIMNLKYLVMPSRDFEAQKALLLTKYQPVFNSSNGSIVLENKTVMPKAWLVPSVVVIADPHQRIGILASAPDFKPDQIALVESPPRLQLAPYPSQVPSLAGRAEVRVYEPNRIVVEAQALKNSLLVIGEKYYRWWYASVDGKKTEIVPVDHILRGVYLTPGTHRVEFIFDPLPFKIGKWLTLGSLAFFVVMLGREWWRRKLQQVARP
ncbi:YfhO family protein [Geobacter sp. AOG2]|uniref:YfhO family protein n=1 Tax=Geobacter sp. AOG2 TaxID=1566347 RepID=UPI001CC33B20|nr:YfhO family protein [Geobacter sp. AOG2]GFE60332.1 membrane protein [Geobacter sp. AOG2]